MQFDQQLPQAAQGDVLGVPQIEQLLPMPDSQPPSATRYHVIDEVEVAPLLSRSKHLNGPLFDQEAPRNVCRASLTRIRGP